MEYFRLSSVGLQSSIHIVVFVIKSITYQNHHSILILITSLYIHAYTHITYTPHIYSYIYTVGLQSSIHIVGVIQIYHISKPPLYPYTDPSLINVEPFIHGIFVSSVGLQSSIHIVDVIKSITYQNHHSILILIFL